MANPDIFSFIFVLFSFQHQLQFQFQSEKIENGVLGVHKSIAALNNLSVKFKALESHNKALTKFNWSYYRT